MITVEITGKTRGIREKEWRDAVCYVRYAKASEHRKIVEDTFRDHDQLDLEYVKQHHPDHFDAPHNVARAILLYHWFRPHGSFFDYQHGEVISESTAPSHRPDAEDQSFALWVDTANVPR